MTFEHIGDIANRVVAKLVLDTKMKRLLKKHAKNSRGPIVAEVHYTINRRAALKERLDKVSVGGKVALYISSMDCDCSRTQSARHMLVPSLVEAWRILERIYEGAEGPTSAYFCEVADYPEWVEHRDLALEAFEDGHPHVVYA